MARLKSLPPPYIGCIAAVLISNHAYGPTLLEFVLHLHNFVLRGSNIGCKREEEILGHALLNCEPRSGVLLIPADQRINGQVRDTGEFFHLAADLTRKTLRNG